MNAKTSTSWGFYGRHTEQAEIDRIISANRWFFCSVSGRRRIGKTTLIQRAIRERSGIAAFYFQVPDSDERGVVQTFQDALEDTGFSTEIVESTCRDFRDMATAIEIMCATGFVVIIDEFQYFHRAALAEFASHLQAVVDGLRDTTKGGLFVLGSIHTEMTAILEDRASPLFNRITHRIEVGHWDFQTVFEMFDAHGVSDPSQRLFLWSLFEGVPKFYRDCFDRGVLTPHNEFRQHTLRQLFFEGSSPLRDEATNCFLRELRGRYDSVLKLLAKKGPCSYRELVAEYGRAGSSSEKQLSAYLQTLIDRYGMIEKRQPIFAADKSRKARYQITDNFLAAWLLALARNVQIARIRPIEEAVERADTSLKTHEGTAFEKMIRLLIEECSQKGVGDFPLTDMVRGYWNKADGSDIEIDIIAYNDETATVRFGSCKRSASAHSDTALNVFDDHVDRFLQTSVGRRLSNWTIERALYSPAFGEEHRSVLGSQGYVCHDLSSFAGYLGD